MRVVRARHETAQDSYCMRNITSSPKHRVHHGSQKLLICRGQCSIKVSIICFSERVALVQRCCHWIRFNHSKIFQYVLQIVRLRNSYSSLLSISTDIQSQAVPDFSRIRNIKFQSQLILNLGYHVEVLCHSDKVNNVDQNKSSASPIVNNENPVV